MIGVSWFVRVVRVTFRIRVILTGQVRWPYRVVLSLTGFSFSHRSCNIQIKVFSLSHCDIIPLSGRSCRTRSRYHDLSNSQFSAIISSSAHYLSTTLRAINLRVHWPSTRTRGGIGLGGASFFRWCAIKSGLLGFSTKEIYIGC